MSSPWFPKRWPAHNEAHMQLYSMGTPNGQKISIALEEMRIAYDAHFIDIMADDQFDEDFLKLSPNGKIPTLSDPQGPDGEQQLLMESAAILRYLGEKSGQFWPSTARDRIEADQWLFFQMAHIGPMFGQFGHFYKYAADKTSDDYGKTRYTNEAKRLLAVLEARLEGRDFVLDFGYSIVDMAIWPWVECLEEFYDAADLLGLDDFANIKNWRARIAARPAVKKGRRVCAPWLDEA